MIIVSFPSIVFYGFLFFSDNNTLTQSILLPYLSVFLVVSYCIYFFLNSKEVFQCPIRAN